MLHLIVNWLLSARSRSGWWRRSFPVFRCAISAPRSSPPS